MKYEIEKLCGSCQQSKPLAGFNRNARRKDGLQVYCRECTRAQDKLYESSPKGITTRKISEDRKYQRRLKECPEKLKARYALRYAVRTGHVVKQPCEVCGTLQVEAHHDDYSKPLEVRWRCRAHHADLHRDMAA